MFTRYLTTVSHTGGRRSRMSAMGTQWFKDRPCLPPTAERAPGLGDMQPFEITGEHTPGQTEPDDAPGLSGVHVLRPRLVRGLHGKLDRVPATPETPDPDDGCAGAGGTKSLGPVEGVVVEHPAAVRVGADLEPLGCALAS